MKPVSLHSKKKKKRKNNYIINFCRLLWWFLIPVVRRLYIAKKNINLKIEKHPMYIHKRLKLFYSKNNKKQVDGTSRRGVKGIFHNDPTKGTELF